MKSNKGITLVALVVTIIVLIILAGVSISLILGNDGIVTRAKEGRDKYANAAVYENEQLANVDSYAANLGSITGGSSTPTNPSAPTYTAYAVGDTVTLGGETFYVIEASDSSTATVKLLAAQNVITTEGNANRYKQDASANTLRFDDDSNDYGASEIKTHVDAYKLAVEGRMGSGKTINEARLMTKEEVYALGGSGDSTSGCTGLAAFVNATTYWLGSPGKSYNNANYEWVVNGNFKAIYFLSGDFGSSEVYLDSYFGLRPVLVVLKSNI